MSLPAKKPQSPRNNSPQKAPTASHWQGPLPPPESLQQFDSIVEHGAERVFRMAEIEQKHRIESERAALQTNIETVQAEIRTANNGLLLGAAVSVLSIISAVITSVLGVHWSVSVALVGVPIMSAVRALVLRK